MAVILMKSCCVASASEVVVCPPALAERVDALIKPGESLSALLLDTYQEIERSTKGVAVIDMFGLLPMAQGKDKRFIESLLITSEQLKRVGYEGEVRLYGEIKLMGGTLEDWSIKADIVHGKTIEQLLRVSTYPRRSVVDRVLRCGTPSIGGQRKRTVESITLSFGPSNFLSSVISGHVFTVRIKFGGVQKGDSGLDTPSFIAFSAKYPVTGISSVPRVVGPSSADELIVSDAPIGIEGSPELIKR